MCSDSSAGPSSPTCQWSRSPSCGERVNAAGAQLGALQQEPVLTTACCKKLLLPSEIPCVHPAGGHSWLLPEVIDGVLVPATGAAAASSRGLLLLKGLPDSGSSSFLSAAPCVRWRRLRGGRLQGGHASDSTVSQATCNLSKQLDGSGFKMP